MAYLLLFLALYSKTSVLLRYTASKTIGQFWWSKISDAVMLYIKIIANAYVVFI